MKHHTGAIIDTPDIRDYKFGEEIGHSSLPFDWNTGFDIEEKMGKKIECKDQAQTSSCGGFAWSYYGQVLDYFVDKEYQVKSPKFIYAHTHVTGGGSAGRTNCELVRTKGWGNETDCPLPVPLTEESIIKTSDITAEAFKNALKDKALSYAYVPLDVDTLAQAIRDNNGCIFGITGQNNGTWRTAFPKIPTKLDHTTWNHWLYAGKCKIIKGKKYFGVINSWGDVGEDGWQWISEDYINFKYQGRSAIFGQWTLVAKEDDDIIPITPITKLLKYKMTDKEVKILQTLLKEKGFFPSNIKCTEYFGTITLTSVKKFQKSVGLVEDGIVGPKTLEKLFN